MKENKNTDGFNAPQNYFEDFEERLFLKISEDVIPKNSGFTTPPQYFNDVETSILKQIEVVETPSKGKVITLITKRTLFYAATIAACAILVFTLYTPKSTAYSLDDIQISSIESFIEEENVSINAYEITSMLNEDELNIDDELFSEESLEEYLFENLENTTLLIE